MYVALNKFFCIKTHNKMSMKHLSCSKTLVKKQYDKILPVSTINGVKPHCEKVLFNENTVEKKQKKTYPKSPPRRK